MTSSETSLAPLAREEANTPADYYNNTVNALMEAKAFCEFLYCMTLDEGRFEELKFEETNQLIDLLQRRVVEALSNLDSGIWPTISAAREARHAA